METFVNIICGALLPLLLFGGGIFYLFKLRFFFILHPIKFLASLKKSSGASLKSLSVALAGTLGIGNIVGVSSAVLSGGYGAIFWMVASAFLSMGLKYAEVYLAMKSQRRAKNALFGGAPYYIYDGFFGRLGGKLSFFLASIFAVFCIINSLTTGNLVQVSGVCTIFPIPKLIFGIIFATLVFLIILRGEKSIRCVSSFLIPILCAFYIVLCLAIILKNASSLPYAISEILRGAFDLKSAFGGALGFGIASAIRFGVSRGLLSNEAGAGTSPLAHAVSPAEPHAQACLGIFEVFFDTVVLCSLSGLVLVLSGKFGASDALSFVLGAFESELGAIGKYGVCFSCLFFAIATVAAQYFYGTESLRFITRSRTAAAIFSVIFLLVTTLSALIPSNAMWQISDLALALMTIFNLVAIILLNKKVDFESSP